MTESALTNPLVMSISAMAKKDRTPVSSPSEVASFLEKVASTPVRTKGDAAGRLIFAMDATASREPSWDTACHLQAQMFEETGKLGGLQIQLCYYRGFNEFSAGAWCREADQLRDQMTEVTCRGGRTQITRLLSHIGAESKRDKVQAAVFVGDAFEEETDRVCDLAGQLGLLNVPVFVFQEGSNPQVKSVFQQIAKLSGGAWAPFNTGSPGQLRDLLSAVAVYAAGGRKALADYSKNAGRDVQLLTRQIKE